MYVYSSELSQSKTERGPESLCRCGNLWRDWLCAPPRLPEVSYSSVLAFETVPVAVWQRWPVSSQGRSSSFSSLQAFRPQRAKAVDAIRVTVAARGRCLGFVPAAGRYWCLKLLNISDLPRQRQATCDSSPLIDQWLSCQPARCRMAAGKAAHHSVTDHSAASQCRLTESEDPETDVEELETLPVDCGSGNTKGSTCIGHWVSPMMWCRRRRPLTGQSGPLPLHRRLHWIKFL